MPPIHNFVSSPSRTDSPQPNLPTFPPLEGFKIHPLWRIEAFRVALYDDLLPLTVLDSPQYSFSTILYERMEPALKLATLFLRMTLPDLAKVRYGTFRSEGSGFRTDRVLTDYWRATGNKLQSFERELERMCRYYRITVVGKGEHGSPHGHVETAITGCIGNEANWPDYNPVIVQSGITIDWLHFLTAENWDTLDAAEKYSRYVLIATTLLHELAHAIWCHRMLHPVNNEYRRTGQITVDRPEPRFACINGFEELGYAVELQLFGGLLAFPHFGTPTTAEMVFEQTRDRLLLTIVDIDGRAAGVHPLTTDTIFSLFCPETWISSDAGWFLNFRLDLLPDIRRPGRHGSTVLSDPPPRDYKVPIIQIPSPWQLKGAITETNELFDSGV